MFEILNLELNTLDANKNLQNISWINRFAFLYQPDEKKFPLV